MRHANKDGYGTASGAKMALLGDGYQVDTSATTPKASKKSYRLRRKRELAGEYERWTAHEPNQSHDLEGGDTPLHTGDANDKKAGLSTAINDDGPASPVSQ